MRTMTLSTEQREEILDELRLIRSEGGRFSAEVEFDGGVLDIQGRIDITGYVEDDRRCGGYMMGTGGFVETGREVDIKDIIGYDSEGTECQIDPDSIVIIENFLKMAG